MEALECGVIGINESLVFNEAAPFGGIKESGMGREGSHSGVEEYLTRLRLRPTSGMGDWVALEV
jgi:acyl-CoA reductase-like NAD-dependent aldehyde dehydrogenase